MKVEQIRLAEEHQERMCDLCERNILGCKSMTSTFLCEGSRCEDAVVLLQEELDEERHDMIKYLLIRR